MSGLNSIIESHEEFISATYQCPTKPLSGSHGQVIVSCFAYSVQYLQYRAQRLVPWSNANSSIFWISNTKNQGTQQRKQGISCIHWPHEKIDVRIRGADSHWRALPLSRMFLGQKQHSNRTISSSINLASFCPVIMTQNLSQIYIKKNDVTVFDSSSPTT